MGFKCLAADVIVNYTFGEDFGGIKSDGFDHPIICAMDDLLISAQWALYFRKVFYSLDRMAEHLPNAVLKCVAPSVLGMRKLIWVRIFRFQLVRILMTLRAADTAFKS